MGHESGQCESSTVFDSRLSNSAHEIQHDENSVQFRMNLCVMWNEIHNTSKQPASALLNYRYWNLFLLKGRYLVRPLIACICPLMFIVIFIGLNFFADTCSRFVDMIRSIFPIYTCLGHTLQRSAMDQGKDDGKFTAVECLAVNHQSVRLSPFASVVTCVGRSFAPSHHLSALSVYYWSRWRGGRLGRAADHSFWAWPNDRKSIWYW
jgi:hypothetical protein